ncbi:MAG: response regulator transcription factor [Melioribacteraceae bacterium]|nr:response regulator transcription factor [Melioribacteraceae bacterium]MCF8395826.1 response regulator transcription factor [Melioribacteraceae bacterium]MCF8420920.1 response regulator transcription factor [Melioribacteraceae bacterium]
MRKLIIIEDSKKITKSLSVLISKLQNIELAGTAVTLHQGIELERKTSPDIVILDLGLPDGDGFTFLRQVQKKSNKPRIIVFSNFTYRTFKSTALSLGADYFFDKITETDRLIDMLFELNELETSL